MMASCSVAVRPLPELIEKVRRGELEVPPKNIRRVYGARLDRVVRPFLDVEIPESLARTPLGASVISERTELISAYENAIEKYVRLGTPATLMILAPGGWQIHIDLAVSTETVGAVETGTLACSRYLVIGTAVRATAEMAEQNMAQRGLLGGPETFFQFAPLPPPLPPRPPAFDTELEFATPVDEKGYALPVAAAASAVALPVVPPPVATRAPAPANSVAARIARWKVIAGETAPAVETVPAPPTPATAAVPFVPRPLAERTARWQELAAWLKERGVAFRELPRPVVRAALRYQHGLGPGWRAKLRLPNGDLAEIEYDWP